LRIVIYCYSRNTVFSDKIDGNSLVRSPIEIVLLLLLPKVHCRTAYRECYYYRFLEMWVTEYQVDGLRFDRIGLIDADTMTLAAKED